MACSEAQQNGNQLADTVSLIQFTNGDPFLSSVATNLLYVKAIRNMGMIEPKRLQGFATVSKLGYHAYCHVCPILCGSFERMYILCGAFVRMYIRVWS